MDYSFKVSIEVPLGFVRFIAILAVDEHREENTVCGCNKNGFEVKTRCDCFRKPKLMCME